MSNIKEITAENFAEEVFNEKGKLVLVDFWAPWCGPCRQMSPILDEVAKEMKDKIKIVKVNVAEESNKDLIEEYEISNIPIIKVFLGDYVEKEIIGLRSKESLVDDIEIALFEAFK